MNSRIIKTLYKKEMLDVIRDKKTIIVMIVVPLILYPLLFVVGLQFFGRITSEISHSTYMVAFGDNVDEELVELFLANEEDNSYSFQIVDTDDMENALALGQVDVYIEADENAGKTEFLVHYISSVNNSSYASNYCEEILGRYSDKLTVSLLESKGLDADAILNPIDIDYKDMASSEESAGNILGMILPFMLIISLLLGTAYPAIDATAGERERGTLETLLTFPITNSQLIISKFLAVSTLGIITAVLNVISMGFVCVYMVHMMGSIGMDMSVDMTKFIPAIIVGILCIVAFAVFMSAITMCVCSFATSYKEANNYITPIALVVMFASFIAFLPNVELNSRIALVPVANICLLIKNILVLKFDIGIIAIVLISNVAYGIMAVMFLGKIYNSEAILFGDGSASTGIFERRANMKEGGVPSIGDAWLILAITAVVIIYAGGSVQLDYGMAGVVFTQLAIAGIPIAAAVYMKKDFKKTFRIRSCRLSEVCASVFIILGALLFGMLLTAFTGMLFKGSAENADASMDFLSGNTFMVSLLVVAVLPAICEELMFRGYILSAMEGRYKAHHAILISAALFGLYHMSLVKFFTTALLGVFICYVAYKTNSIVPGMIMHFINNGLSVLFMYYPKEMGRIVPILVQETFRLSDIMLLMAAGILFVSLGILILKKFSKNNTLG